MAVDETLREKEKEREREREERERECGLCYGKAMEKEAYFGKVERGIQEGS